MSVKENIIEIEKQLNPDVTLVAATKTKPVAVLQEAYYAGCKIFGENKVQEMVEKYESCPQGHQVAHDRPFADQQGKVPRAFCFPHPTRWTA